VNVARWFRFPPIVRLIGLTPAAGGRYGFRVFSAVAGSSFVFVFIEAAETPINE
jgi:hypothetical protein